MWQQIQHLLKSLLTLFASCTASAFPEPPGIRIISPPFMLHSLELYQIKILLNMNFKPKQGKYFHNELIEILKLNFDHLLRYLPRELPK